ncbi:MAG: hypothetical protein ACREAS_09095 [Nitrososphaera sp.]
MDKIVRIRDFTYDELAKRGRWNDTMDSIIQKLLCQQKDNHAIDDTPKSEREERHRKKMVGKHSDEDKNVLQGASTVGSQEEHHADDLVDSLSRRSNSSDNDNMEVAQADVVSGR